MVASGSWGRPVFVRFIRPPYSSGYNFLDVREDAIITYMLGYLEAIGFRDFDVKDFHLQRNLTIEALAADKPSAFVIVARESGAGIHYAIRLARALRRRSGAPVFFYGQTGRLAALGDLSDTATPVVHDESCLAAAIGLRPDGPRFSADLRARSYWTDIQLSESQRKRLKASLETSRGCHYSCSFCFINSGQNYPKRWTLRSTAAVVEDLAYYRSRNVEAVVFHDSEFFGNDSRDYPSRRELLAPLAREVTPPRSMIYARADTLDRFADYDLLASAGVAQVFVGVESLDEGDRKALRKGISNAVMFRVIDNLRSRGIGMYLSFMLFNRSTTVSTLRTNVNSLKQILAGGSHHLLGMPKFLFTFESDWTGSNVGSALSERSYLRWMAWKRAQPHSGVSFDPKLEPLVEVCRLVNYELTVKLTEANLARDRATKDESLAIDTWFAGLWPFAVTVLEMYVDRFERGELTMASLPKAIEEVYAFLAAHHRNLPDSMARLATIDHAMAIASGSGAVALEDHGWDCAIPGGVYGDRWSS